MKTTFFCLLAAAFLMSGCESLRNTLGVDHYQPDEFNVAADNPPLSVPPDYRLRPPQAGQPAQAKGCATDNDACRRAQNILGASPEPAPKQGKPRPAPAAP